MAEILGKPLPQLPSLRIVFALVMREMTTRYTRLAGGYLWAIVEPVAAIALLSFVFSQAFRSPPVGVSFALFYATGYLPLMLYTDLSEKTASAINFSRQLLFYPAVTFVDALLARFLLNLLTQVLVFTLVIGGILLIGDARARPDFERLVLALSMGAALGFGFGAINCLLFSIFPIWQRLWGVLSRPLFIISCLFYTFESLPSAYQDILWFNPLVHVVGEMRAGLYPTYDAPYVSRAYVFGLSLVTAVFGLLLLRRFKSRILND